MINQAFKAVGLHCSYQERISGFRRFWGVVYETIKQLLTRKTDYGLVLTDSLEYVPLAWFIAALIRKPLVVRVRGDYWAEMNQRVRCGGHRAPGMKLMLYLYGSILRKARAVIPVCDYLKSPIMQNARIKASQLYTVPISVSIKDSDGLSCVGSDQNITLLTVTNFRFPDKVRCLEAYMPSVVALLNEFPGMQIVIAGGGPYLEVFKNTIAPIIQRAAERVHILGYVNDIETLYAKATLFIYLTGLDALPRTLLEAQSYGLPIITTDTGGIRTIIDHEKTGIVCESPDEFLNRARQLIASDELRNSLGRNALTSVRERFSPVTVGNQWLAVLNQIKEAHH